MKVLKIALTSGAIAALKPKLPNPVVGRSGLSERSIAPPSCGGCCCEILREQGFDRVYLDTAVLEAVPKAAFIANGYRYNRDRFEITSANSRIRVIAGTGPRDRKLYGGTLQLQPNAYGTYTLVNDVPIETYLRGVVPHEIGPSAPRTAIETQAILARTYALRNLRRFAIDDYELCADTHCQVYWGLGGTVTVADQAIVATRGPGADISR